MKRKEVMFASVVMMLAGTTWAQQAQQNPRMPERAVDATGALVLRGQAARDEAAAKGWALRMTIDGNTAELVEVRNGRPQYYVETNADAAETSSVDRIFGTGSLWGLTGAGVTIGQWESDGPLRTHQELSGATTNQEALGTSRHASHVACTMIGTGVKTSARGMAVNAQINNWDWTNDVTEMSTAAGNGLRLSNHSYGFSRGWAWDDNANIFRWWGDTSISTTEDYLFGFYDTNSAALDNLAIANRNYLICWAAGNDRNDIGPGPGNTYLVMNSFGTWVNSTAPRNPDGPWDCISQEGVAKNVLTVGAVQDINGGYSTPEDVLTTGFTSFGPCDDGRIKPDLVANGDSLTSATDTGDDQYAVLSGTSMSTPVVTGTAALLLEHWRDYSPSFDPRSSTMKALLINTADEAGSADGPDYRCGWGLLNAERAVEQLDAWGAGNTVAIRELVLLNGNTIEIEFVPTQPHVRATICWTDPAGTPAAMAIDPVTPMLVNDLDLRIVGPDGGTSTIMPWRLDPTDPGAPATRGDNTVDNVEQVDATLTPGRVYRARISHKGSIGGLQRFALVIRGAEQAPTVFHVNADGARDGGSWGEPFLDLSNALEAAAAASGPVEIWVAEGTYTPTTERIPGIPSSRTFDVPNWTKVLGGFAGTEAYRSERDPEANITILSGDIDGNDQPGGGNTSENVNQVVSLGSTNQFVEIDGFTITGGIGRGGGMEIISSEDVVVRDCLFTGNHGTDGSGIWSFNASLRIEDCRFIENHGSGRGGAAYSEGDRDPTYVRCDFINNSATSDGGALYGEDYSGTIASCRFYNNASNAYGGGVQLTGPGDCFIQNCVMAGNSSLLTGGAMDIYRDASPEITYSTIMGNYSSSGGGGISAEDIPFAGGSNLIIRDNRDGTPSGNDQIATTSDAILLFTWCNIEGGYIGVNNVDVDPLLVNPRGWDGEYGTSDDNYRPHFLSPMVDAGNDGVLHSDPADLDGDTITDEDMPVDLAGVMRRVGSDSDIGAYEWDPANPSVIHVKPDGTGSSGNTWASAVNSVTGATALAALGARPVEIWIAEGTYEPLVLFGGRSTSFVLEEDVSFVGGFGGTEWANFQRDPIGDPVTLTGDLNGDDLPGFGNRDDNVYQVIDASGAGGTSGIIGLTIRGGQADGTDSADRYGAGIGCDEGRLFIDECIVEDNHASLSGGGIYAIFADVTILNSIVRDNYGNNGGGLYINRYDDFLMSDTDVINNEAGSFGGGLHEEAGAGLVHDCRFLGNHADSRGGGSFATSTDTIFVQCEWIGNSSARGGGIGTSQHADLQIINSTIARNSATTATGGLYCDGVGTRPNLSNCILAENDLNGAMDESAQVSTALFAGVEVHDSLVEGWSGSLTGDRSFDGNPDFDDLDGSDNTIGTADDDPGLGSASDAIDRGNNTAVPDTIMVDIEGNLRFIDATYASNDGIGPGPIVDLGAREAPAEVTPNCYGDVNGDSQVNFADLEELLDNWGGNVPAGTAGDVDGNGVVNFADLNALLDAWGTICF